MHKTIACFHRAPNITTKSTFVSPLHHSIQAFCDRFPTDQLFLPENWSAALLCVHHIIQDFHPQGFNVCLGSSMSWLLQIVQMMTHDAIDPTYIAFSGKNPQLVSLDTIQGVELNALPKPHEWDQYTQYMTDIGCTPAQWLTYDGPIRIFEYSESGRGLLSFLGTLHHFALESGIEPARLFDKIECVLFRPQKSIQAFGQPFPHFPCSQITYSLPDIDLCLDRICNDDTVRWVPSFNWFKLQGDYPVRLFERSADAQEKRALLRSKISNLH